MKHSDPRQLAGLLGVWWCSGNVCSVYPAVVIDETQPLHGHVSHMTPPEQDFAWREEIQNLGLRGEMRKGVMLEDKKNEESTVK